MSEDALGAGCTKNTPVSLVTAAAVPSLSGEATRPRPVWVGGTRSGGMMRNIVTWVVTACLLAGCVTVPPPSLSVEDVSSWKLIGVEGALADTARIGWPKVEDEFLAANLSRAPDTTSTDREGNAVTVPGAPLPLTDDQRRAARALVQSRFTERVRLHLEPLGAAMVGQRPVKIRATLRRLDVPSLGAQIVKGVAMAVMFGAAAASAQNQSTLELTTDVVDAKTGAVLLSYPSGG